MRIIGVDPGSRYTGYGIIHKSGSELSHVASGRIHAANAETFVERLDIIYSGLVTILDEYECDQAAAESIFTHRNAMSSLKLGHARGVALLALTHAGLDVVEYAPAKVKKSVAGHGRASKDTMGLMVRRSLGIDVAKMTEDAADALAVAICHAGAVDFLKRLE